MSWLKKLGKFRLYLLRTLGFLAACILGFATVVSSYVVGLAFSALVLGLSIYAIFAIWRHERKNFPGE